MNRVWSQIGSSRAQQAPLASTASRARLTLPACARDPFRRIATAALLAIGAVVLFAQVGGKAQTATTDALTYADGFLLTGGYVVGGVDLPKNGGVGTINFDAAHNNTVPPDADIVAAYLYWETITSSTNPLSGATFRGSPVNAAKVSLIDSLPGSGASCWGAAGGSTSKLFMGRADVLPLLPKRLDASGQWTGKYIVNDADLVANSLPLHTISLPQQGTGNVLTQSAGASLVLVYRDLSKPFRKIVIYDGAYAQPQGATMTQTIRAIYKSSAVKSAKITHIVGSGAANTSDRLLFNNSVVATNPIPAPIDSSADRGWANPTYDVSSLMPGTTTNDGYGETVTTSVDHTDNNSPYDCLAWAAVIFSTSEADVDGDGLPDGVEDASGGLKDPPTPYYPAGRPLPNLNQMGANSGQKDLFVEVNAMWAPAGTTYGSANAPVSSTTASVTDTAGHNHLPMPGVFKSLGDTYLANGIHVHFDVGDTTAYYGLPGYACPAGHPECNADPYLVPSAYARGGEAIEERACVSNGTVECQFPDYPGTVGWRLGLQLYQDAPVADDGSELTAQQIIDTWGSGSHRRRFDRVRNQFFHYLFYGHARGKGRSKDPCLDGSGNPAAYNQTSPVNACVSPYTDNPQFHVPTSASGVADLPGSAAMITLGFWDNFLGTPFVQTSTTLHELGHNLNLWHGGAPAIWGNAATGTNTSVEPNCKPNYLSSMSYLFQVHGLWDDAGVVHANYSGSVSNSINETISFTDASLFPVPTPAYAPSWYVPSNSYLAVTLGATESTRYCTGAKFDPLAPQPHMARVRGLTSGGAIDWNGDGLIASSPAQDVNFDGTLGASLNGYNDWASVRLDQIGASRIVRVFSNASGDFLDFGSGDFTDFGSGDFTDFGSGDFLDFGSGTYYVHFASGSFSGDFLDFGSGDFTDFGSGDFLDFGSGVWLAGAAGTFQDASGDFTDFGSGDFIDFGSGDFSDFGSGDFSDFGSGDFLDFGSGDFVDFGSGDFADFGSGAPQELDFDQAREMGRTPPSGVAACVLGATCTTGTQPAPFDAQYHNNEVRWTPPAVGHVSTYRVYRIYGSVVTASTIAGATLIGSVPGTQVFFTDQEELPNGYAFTYFVRAVFDDGPASNPNPISGVSNFTTITAINDAPVANADTYSMMDGTTLLTIAPAGVLTNDTDDDTSNRSLLKAVLVTTTTNGTLSLAADGSFSYAPNVGFIGTDTFTYKVNDGRWISGAVNVPMSADSNTATVTITVLKRTKKK